MLQDLQSEITSQHGSKCLELHSLLYLVYTDPKVLRFIPDLCERIFIIIMLKMRQVIV